MNKKRLRNYGLWVAIVALVLDILVYSHVITLGDSQAIQGFAQRALELLVVLGIVSNPTRPDGKGFNL